MVSCVEPVCHHLRKHFVGGLGGNKGFPGLSAPSLPRVRGGGLGTDFAFAFDAQSLQLRTSFGFLTVTQKGVHGTFFGRVFILKIQLQERRTIWHSNPLSVA